MASIVGHMIEFVFVGFVQQIFSSVQFNLYYRLRGSPDIFTQITEKRYSNVQYEYRQVTLESKRNKIK